MHIETAEEFIALADGDSYEDTEGRRFCTASIETWTDICERYPERVIAVILNKNVPVEILWKLSDHEEVNVRLSIAQKRKCGPELFIKLATDPYDGVRMTVACNPKAPAEVLKVLAEDPHPEVRTRARERLAEGE